MMNAFYVVVNEISLGTDSLVFGLFHDLSGVNVTAIVHEKAPFEPSYDESALSAIPAEEVALRGNALFFSIPRFDGARDRLCNQFKVIVQAGEDRVEAEGICHVTDIGEIAENTLPFPDPGTIKGLQVHETDDAMALGIKHAGFNVNQPSLARPVASADTIPFTMDGRVFHFDRNVAEQYDAHIRKLSSLGANVYLILLNSPTWSGTTIHPDMKEILFHPDFTENDEEARISAFNTVTSEGFAHYKAFIGFVCQRYMNKTGEFGRAQGLIISNEVNSQYVWGNAGEKTVEEFASLYSIAMRTAWYVMQTYSSTGRVYLSLEHHWTLAYKPEPKRYYGGKALFDALISLSVKEGNYGWGMAHHPYPENLFYCDFWNDETATDSFETGRITFKNLHILTQYLNLPVNTYRGQCRHIILSEQGFHCEYTEEWEGMQKAAYCLAYEKVLRLPDIDCFIYHAHHDNKFEFGLNLGVRRRDEEGNPTDPKPIYFAMRDMDTDKRDALLEEARTYLGKRLEGHKSISIDYGPGSQEL